MTMPVQKPGQSKQDYATPRDFLDAVEAHYGKLDFDLAAHEANHVTPNWYGPGGIREDSLDELWNMLRGNLWLNPPFGYIEPWAAKCAKTLPLLLRSRIFFLVPASIGSEWFAKHVYD